MASINGNSIAKQALTYLGNPYVYAGNPYQGGPGVIASDCSGLVDRVMSDLGHPLGGRPIVGPTSNHDSNNLTNMGQGIAVAGSNGLANAEPGDLLILEGGDHVAIYLGNGQLVEDPTTGQSVSQRAVYQTPYAIRRLTTAGSGSNSGLDQAGKAAKGANFLLNPVSGILGTASGIKGAADTVTNIPQAISSVAAPFTIIADFFEKLSWLTDFSNLTRLWFYIIAGLSIVLGFYLIVKG